MERRAAPDQARRAGRGAAGARAGRGRAPGGQRAQLAALARAVTGVAGPRAVCGDLNTPRRETPAGELVTFARDSRGRLRPERGEEWDAAEAALFTTAGLVDAFRSLHGYEHREPSWTWRRFPRSGYRLDHILVSPDVAVERCEYRHEWRTAGLSDHSGLEAELSPS